MKGEIQVSLPGVQYSRVQVQLETGSDQEIKDALLYLDRVCELHLQNTKKEKPTTSTAPQEVLSVLEEENKQLKGEQEVHQQVLNLLKNENPELYFQIMKQVNAEADFDKRTNDEVDDRLLEKDL